MKTVNLRDAKATLSALVDAAEHGEATTITRHGKAVAVLMPIKDVRHVVKASGPSFAELLMAYPGGLDFDRDRSPMRDIDL